MKERIYIRGAITGTNDLWNDLKMHKRNWKVKDMRL